MTTPNDPQEPIIIAEDERDTNAWQKPTSAQAEPKALDFDKLASDYWCEARVDDAMKKCGYDCKDRLSFAKNLTQLCAEVSRETLIYLASDTDALYSIVADKLPELAEMAGLLKSFHPVKIEANIPVEGTWLVYSPHDGKITLLIEKLITEIQKL